MLTLGYALQPLPGWATLVLGDGARQVELEAAWSDDVLRHLVSGAADLLDGAAHLRVVLDAETSQGVLLVDRDGDHVVVRALSGDTAAQAVLQLQAEGSVRGLATGVAQAAQQVLAAHGEDGYRSQWGEHPFPSAELARLQAALRR